MQFHPTRSISKLKKASIHSRHTMPKNGANLGVSSLSAITADDARQLKAVEMAE